MRGFADHHPMAVAVYFLAVSGVAMFCMDPVILALSLAGAAGCFAVLVHRGGKTHWAMAGLFLAMALINPLVSHRGITVLLVVNHNPVTLESLWYGLAAAAMVVAVVYWFRCFSAIMTSDRLLCVLGGLSPKLALILSMALRYVPLFGQQAHKVNQAQKALGLYREDNLIDTMRGGMRVFSVMVTWALENGIITADSMAARGYGLGKRTQFSLFRWQVGDVLLAVLSVLLAAAALWGAHSRGFVYYPAVTANPFKAVHVAGYAAYAVLAALPVIIQAKEAIRWRWCM